MGCILALVPESESFKYDFCFLIYCCVGFYIQIEDKKKRLTTIQNRCFYHLTGLWINSTAQNWYLHSPGDQTENLFAAINISDYMFERTIVFLFPWKEQPMGSKEHIFGR